MDVVTGAFSFTGRYIAARLLESGREVRTLTRRPQAESPFGDRVRAFPFDRDGTAAALHGADTLYNTYWIRFPNRSTTFEDAARNSVALLDAARSAEREAGRPPERDPRLRRIALRLLPRQGDRGGGGRRVGALARDRQADARLRHRRGARQQRRVAPAPAARLRPAPHGLPDPAGRRRGPGRAVRRCRRSARRTSPSTRQGRTSSLSRSSSASCARRSARAPLSSTQGRRTVLSLARGLDLVTRETLLTSEELGALADDLLTSDEPPRGTRRFADWVSANAEGLGRQLATGERRPWPK